MARGFVLVINLPADCLKVVFCEGVQQSFGEVLKNGMLFLCNIAGICFSQFFNSSAIDAQITGDP